MKIIFDFKKTITLIITIISIYSCESLFPEEGAYTYRGYIYNDSTLLPIDCVLCQIYIIESKLFSDEEELYESCYSDSIGYYFLDWCGYIDKYDARIQFQKDGYKSYEISASLEKGNYNFNDTIFMTKE